MHRLSIREKREFYSGLARLIRSGTALPAAIDLLARDTPRGLRHFLRALNERIRQGEPLGDALLMQRPRVTDLEASIVTAAGRSGRLDKACDQLARYFEALERAQSQITARVIYPVVMLHLTVLILHVSTLMSDGLGPFLWQVAKPLGTFYMLAVGIWLASRGIANAARGNAALDMAVKRIPGVGPIRERFALARFYTTLDAQLDAQVNIWDAFANAARTSGSGRIIAAARDAMPMLQSGERLSEALSAKRVIPDEHIRALRVAEQTGEVDAELSQLAQKSEEAAVTSLERWSEWLPRIIYVAVLLYAGYQIIQTYVGVLGEYKSFM